MCEIYMCDFLLFLEKFGFFRCEIDFGTLLNNLDSYSHAGRWKIFFKTISNKTCNPEQRTIRK